MAEQRHRHGATGAPPVDDCRRGWPPLGLDFTHFGTRVTVLEAMDRVLSREEPEVSQELQRCLEAEGIESHVGVTLDGVSERGGKKVVAIRGGGGVQRRRSLATGMTELAADKLLLAAGVQANTGDLDLAKAGVKVNRNGFIQVNQHYQTDNPSVFAAGTAWARCRWRPWPPEKEPWPRRTP